jgi:ABC-type nitrate/sulfonate/bicarbonate transport system permease component
VQLGDGTRTCCLDASVGSSRHIKIARNSKPLSQDVRSSSRLACLLLNRTCNKLTDFGDVQMSTLAPPIRPALGSDIGHKRVRRTVQFVLGPVLLIAIWWVAYAGTLVDPHLLPSPFATLADTWVNIVSGAMTRDFLQTLLRVLYAFAIATSFGVPIGIVLGANESVYRSVEFIIDFFRSTPATAMFPLFLLLFGLGDFSKISVAAFAAWLVIVFNVAYGVMNARQTRILAARSMGASPLRIFKDVIFFETLPQTFVGLRTAVSIALVVIIVAEMFIGAVDGLGHRIIDAQISYQLTDMYGSILIAGAMGYGANLLFLVIEKLFVHWSGR